MQGVDVETRSFRLAYAHLWLWAGIANLALIGLCVLATNLAGLQVDPLWVVVMGIMPAFFWITYGLKYQLTVSANGLGWVNSSGAKCFLPWQDIEKAEVQSQLGFRVLRVWSKAEQESFWMPIFVRNHDLLTEALLESAGATHPVAVAVADHGREVV